MGPSGSSTPTRYLKLCYFSFVWFRIRTHTLELGRKRLTTAATALTKLLLTIFNEEKTSRWRWSRTLKNVIIKTNLEEAEPSNQTPTQSSKIKAKYWIWKITKKQEILDLTFRPFGEIIKSPFICLRMHLMGKSLYALSLVTLMFCFSKVC